MTDFIPNRFEGKVMILTGSARGIGECVAYRAAKEGAKLVLADRIADLGQAVCDRITADGGDAIFLPLDVSVEENVEQLVAAAVEKYGRLDIAINNAGVMGNPNPLHDVPKEDMDYTMRHNFYSVYFCCKHEIRRFLAQGSGGVIMNVASIAGMTGLPGNPAYNASKHAVNGLTKNLAIDYAKQGIRVNSVNPSGTTTPMVKEAYDFVMAKINEAIAAGVDPSELATMAGQKQKNMFERELLPEEQAAVILFMVSDEASCMTGATIQSDGGWTSF